MIVKCGSCDKRYVDDGETICVECAVSDLLDNEAFERYLIEKDIADVSADKLNDIGVSVLWDS